MSHDHDSHYTPEVKAKMSASARAVWQRRKAAGYVSQRAMKAAAPALYAALRGMVQWFACQRGAAPVEAAKRALAQVEGSERG